LGSWVFESLYVAEKSVKAGCLIGLKHGQIGGGVELGGMEMEMETGMEMEMEMGMRS
jgi:hypothetical protein